LNRFRGLNKQRQGISGMKRKIDGFGEGSTNGKQIFKKKERKIKF
jgi:hypothetical protein